MTTSRNQLNYRSETCAVIILFWWEGTSTISIRRLSNFFSLKRSSSEEGSCRHHYPFPIVADSPLPQRQTVRIESVKNGHLQRSAQGSTDLEMNTFVNVYKVSLNGWRTKKGLSLKVHPFWTLSLPSATLTEIMSRLIIIGINPRRRFGHLMCRHIPRYQLSYYYYYY